MLAASSIISRLAACWLLGAAVETPLPSADAQPAVALPPRAESPPARSAVQPSVYQIAAKPSSSAEGPSSLAAGMEPSIGQPGAAPPSYRQSSTYQIPSSPLIATPGIERLESGVVGSPPAAENPPPNPFAIRPQSLHYEGNGGWIYPSFAKPYAIGGPWASFPRPYPFTSTPEHPYPPDDPYGPYAPLPFRNNTPPAPADKGVIQVFLPSAEADVYLNGQKTRGIGTTRRLLTGLMPPGGEFQYWVTASYLENGEKVTKYRKVEVGAGEYTVADFLRQPLFDTFHLPPGPVDTNQLVPPTPTAGKYWP